MGKSTFAWAGVEKASFNETGTLRVALESFKGHMARTSNLKKRFGEENANSRYLLKLFPEGATKSASKFAGLPKPKNCK